MCIRDSVETVDSPKADPDREWDADAAKKRVKKWATNADGSMDWKKWRKAFTWWEGDDAEVQSAYKLPHHDIIDGELKVVLRGVQSARGVLDGAMGGVDMPETERAKAKGHLDYHLRQFGKEREEKSCGCEDHDWLQARSLLGTKAPEVDTGNRDYDQLLDRNHIPIEKFEMDLEDIVSEWIRQLVKNGVSQETAASAEVRIQLEKAARSFVESVTLTSGEDALADLSKRTGVDFGASFNTLDPAVDVFLRTYS